MPTLARRRTPPESPERNRIRNRLSTGCGGVDPARLRRSLIGLPLPRGVDGRIILAVDVSARDCGRTQPPALREVTAGQVREVINRLRTAGHWHQGDPPILVVFDAGYDVTRLVHLLDDLPVESDRYGTAIPPRSRLMSHTGRWRIVEMELWDAEAIELLGPGLIEFDEDLSGRFRFIAVQGWMDCREGERDGRACVEFTWEGNDESDPASGRGWAVLADNGSLEGRIFFHFGDDSSFRAVRTEPEPTSTQGPSGGAREWPRSPGGRSA